MKMSVGGGWDLVQHCHGAEELNNDLTVSPWLPHAVFREPRKCKTQEFLILLNVDLNLETLLHI